EKQEFRAMQRMEKLEARFEMELARVKTQNMSIHWHTEMLIDSDYEIVNVLIVTDYCYYLFVLHDLAGEFYINPFNILCRENHEAELDLEFTCKVMQYEKVIAVICHDEHVDDFIVTVDEHFCMPVDTHILSLDPGQFNFESGLQFFHALHCTELLFFCIGEGEAVVKELIHFQFFMLLSHFCHSCQLNYSHCRL